MAGRIDASDSVDAFRSPAFAGVPLDTVKANVNGVLDVLRDPKLQGEAGKKVKEQRIEAAAEKLFDFVELSKRTLGLTGTSLPRTSARNSSSFSRPSSRMPTSTRSLPTPTSR